MKKSWRYLVSAALGLVSATALAATAPAATDFTIHAGDDGLSTTPGSTTVDLARFPIEEVFGAPVEGSTVVSLMGESLGPQNALAGIDTIVRRPRDISLIGGVGEGPLVIMALRLLGQNPVTIGGTDYTLRVFLSEFRTDVVSGTLRLQAMNGDGGTFSSSFNVRPKLTFTSESGESVVIDCGVVPCGEDLQLTAVNRPFIRSGGPGGFQGAGIKKLSAGIPVDGDGNGSPDFTTRASTNLYIGIEPIVPPPPPPPLEKRDMEHTHRISVPTPTAVALVAPFPGGAVASDPTSDQ
ncbi:MAG TPA: hypothetical protein VF789_32060 [Thermoanaerobaculia bacterium]